MIGERAERIADIERQYGLLSADVQLHQRLVDASDESGSRRLTMVTTMLANGQLHHD